MLLVVHDGTYAAFIAKHQEVGKTSNEETDIADHIEDAMVAVAVLVIDQLASHDDKTVVHLAEEELGKVAAFAINLQQEKHSKIHEVSVNVLVMPIGFENVHS